MPCDTVYRRLEVQERVKVDTAIEKLVKLLASGMAQVKVNPVTGKPMIVGWVAPKGMADLCCLAMAQAKGATMQADWKAALAKNPAMQGKNFVGLHNAAHAKGENH